MSLTTPAASAMKDRLVEIEESVGSLRDQHAAELKAAKVSRDAALKTEDKVANARHASEARAHADRANQIKQALAALQDEQTGMLKQLVGDGAGAIDGLQAAGQDPVAVKRLAGQPGAWLSGVLASHRDSALRTLGRQAAPLSPMASAPVQLGVGNVSTETQSAVLIEALQPYTVALKSGIPMLAIDTTKTRIPRFTDLPVAGWVAEFGAFPTNAPGMEMVDVAPPKVGLISPLSIEIFEDLTPYTLAMIQTNIVKAVGRAYDEGILFGDGTDDAPIGVANTSGVLSVTQPLTGLKPFGEGLAVLIGQNAFPGALVMNPLDLGLLLQQTEFLGDTDSNVPLWKTAIERASSGVFSLNLPYFGTPVWPTPAAPRGTALMYDPTEILAVVRREADIAIDPYYDFDNGLIGLRSYLRGSVVVGQAKGAVVITLGSNITATAASDIVTAAAHGLADGTAVKFTKLTGGAGLDETTTYYVAVLDANSFKVSVTPGGAAVDITSDATAGVVIRV